MQRESMEFDVVIVGAGPAGLTAAIRLKQLKSDCRVCVVEKGREVGAHILSGAVIEPRTLTELIPDWKARQAPLHTPALDDRFYFLSPHHRFRLPLPPELNNKGNYIVSLSALCRWLGKQAETLGVEIFPGFAATELLYQNDGSIQGIVTGEFGVDKNGEKGPNYQPGIELLARKVLLAEGCRGSLTKDLIQRFRLEGDCPQIYGIGIKEVWEVPPELHKPGRVLHTIGWPLSPHIYGGSFLYHFGEDLISVGFVIGLDYKNPTLNPFLELQKFKTHPFIRSQLEKGRRIEFGARAVNEGGFQSIPQLEFPGGMIIGAAAGFMNMPKLKGTHTAMKSAIVAAETVHHNLYQGKDLSYKKELSKTWVWKELYRARNIRPAFQKGLWWGLCYSALDSFLLRGKAPWTLKHPMHGDHGSLQKINGCKKIEYSQPDGKLTFDKLSSVYLSNTNHVENQPCHLRLQKPERAIEINWKEYGSPEQYYCPVGVYEIIKDEKGDPRLQINAQNCVHCKTCDIKDPTQNIHWIPPEGGGGPCYTHM
ncbi:MAG: electron transfer flavoprotein-ubiquinone oxidoreductase [Gammaproteobacteria bacterium]|nr:electron transfer flavoprotein-ubiquinone oxidoreductase [Gammaproteobacteria bacterium]